MLLKHKGAVLVLLGRSYVADVGKAIYVKFFRIPDTLETA